MSDTNDPNLPEAAEPFHFFRRTPVESVEVATERALEAQAERERTRKTNRRVVLETNIGMMVRNGTRAQKNMMELLRFRIYESGVDREGVSLADQRLVQLLEMYDESKRLERKFDTDQACFACSIHPAECYAWFAEEAMRHSRNIALAAVAAAGPKIVQASIAHAQRPEGFNDRRMHMEAMGYVRPRGGQTTTVKVENTNMNENRSATVVQPVDPRAELGFAEEQRRVSSRMFQSPPTPKALLAVDTTCTTEPSSNND